MNSSRAICACIASSKGFVIFIGWEIIKRDNALIYYAAIGTVKKIERTKRSDNVLLKLCSHRYCKEQPITRIEDRLFDRGWVRFAMATRKCRNIYFPKYFMAVRPFFTRIFYQELFGLEGSKTFLEHFRQVHNLKISNRLLRSKSFFFF